MTDIRQSIGLPPTETVEFFRAKGYLPAEYRENWDGIWQEEHARWFTVTKLFNNQLLEEVRRSLDKVISEGGTFEQWKKGILPKLSAPGATGVDPRLLTSNARLRVVYDTNLRMARAAGKWKRIQVLKGKAPYLMYDAVNDGHTRPLHRAWGGLDNGRPIILPVDHPAWRIFFPPCGWGCRCGVIQLSERDLKRQGLSLTTDAELIALGWPTAGGVPVVNDRRYQRNDGTIVAVPAGVDPGFAYNPGESYLAALQPPPTSGPLQVPHITPTVLPPLPAPRSRPATDMLPRDTAPEIAIDDFLHRFGTPDAQDNVMGFDASGEPVVAGPSFFYRGGEKAGKDTEKLVDRDRVQFMPLFVDTILDPDEIWWIWEEQRNRDGTPAPRRLTRRHIARFDVDGKVVATVVVMKIGPGGWRGVSAIVAARKGYVEKPQVRGGVLAYRRP